eukprot:5997745-Amphidinium_carterae.1
MGVLALQERINMAAVVKKKTNHKHQHGPSIPLRISIHQDCRNPCEKYPQPGNIHNQETTLALSELTIEHKIF